MLNFFQNPFGLDISDHSIEVVSLSGSPEKPKLLAMGRILLEPGIVKESKILNKDSLAKNLKVLISHPQFGKINSKNFIFAIPESKILVHFFNIPDHLKEKERLAIIKEEVIKTFPYHLEDLYYDFSVRDTEVLLVAAPKNIIKDYLKLFEDCQIQPLAFGIESESLAKALIGYQLGTILIIDMGAKMTNFNVFEDSNLRLSISLPIAGEKFTKAISENLGVSLAEAEKMKREIGLSPHKKEGRIFLILQQEFRGIIEEIKNIDEYFQNKTGKKIDKIILSGGSILISHIQEYLFENLEKETIVGDPWKKINIDILREKEYLKEALEIEPIFYSAVIGAALRGLEKDYRKTGINFLKDIKYK